MPQHREMLGSTIFPPVFPIIGFSVTIWYISNKSTKLSAPRQIGPNFFLNLLSLQLTPLGLVTIFLAVISYMYTSSKLIE